MVLVADGGRHTHRDSRQRRQRRQRRRLATAAATEAAERSGAAVDLSTSTSTYTQGAGPVCPPPSRIRAMLVFFDAIAVGSRPEATAAQRAALELHAQQPAAVHALPQALKLSLAGQPRHIERGRNPRCARDFVVPRPAAPGCSGCIGRHLDSCPLSS